jgi:DNA-binding winged helix-turn-helix (wHTH) protein
MSALSEGYPLPRRTRFGKFEADLHTRELLREGERVPLQRQPFEILALLLERAGDLVSRSDMKRAICGDGINLDLEHSVNRAINKLRNALGDCADQPTIIETLPGRGCHLIAPVAMAGSSSLGPGELRQPLVVAHGVSSVKSMHWCISRSMRRIA